MIKRKPFYIIRNRKTRQKVKRYAEKQFEKSMTRIYTALSTSPQQKGSVRQSRNDLSQISETNVTERSPKSQKNINKYAELRFETAMNRIYTAISGPLSTPSSPSATRNGKRMARSIDDKNERSTVSIGDVEKAAFSYVNPEKWGFKTKGLKRKRNKSNQTLDEGTPKGKGNIKLVSGKLPQLSPDKVSSRRTRKKGFPSRHSFVNNVDVYLRSY